MKRHGGGGAWVLDIIAVTHLTASGWTPAPAGGPVMRGVRVFVWCLGSALQQAYSQEEGLTTRALAKADRIRIRWNATPRADIRALADNGTLDVALLQGVARNFSWFQANPWYAIRSDGNASTCASNLTHVSEPAAISELLSKAAQIRRQWGINASVSANQTQARAEINSNRPWAQANPWIRSNGNCAVNSSWGAGSQPELEPQPQPQTEPHPDSEPHAEPMQACKGSYQGKCNEKCEPLVYRIQTHARGKGKPCPAQDGDKKQCAPGEGSCPENINCEGSWPSTKECSKNCTPLAYTVVVQKQGQGKACPAKQGQLKQCLEGEGQCPRNIDCQGQWSKCLLNCSDIVYTITTQLSGRGKSCPKKDGEKASCDVGDGACQELKCPENRFNVDKNRTNGCEVGCPAVKNSNCLSCSSPQSCTKLSKCTANTFDTNENAKDGCEAGCPVVGGGKCTACSDANTCTRVQCDANRWDLIDPRDGCEATCPDVAFATCAECATGAYKDTVCTKLDKCYPNRFDADSKATTGCEQGCPALPQATCTACSHPSTCTKLSCAPGWSNADGNNTNGCESFPTCDGTTSFCGCPVANFERKKLSSGKLDCVRCPDGYYGTPDATPTTTTRACLANVCTKPVTQTGFLLGKADCVSATEYLPARACKAQAKNLGKSYTRAAECLAAALADSDCDGDSVMWSTKYNKNLGCRCCKKGEAAGGKFDRFWGVYKMGAATKAITCSVQPACDAAKEYTGDPKNSDHSCPTNGGSLVLGGCTYNTQCDGSGDMCVCKRNQEVTKAGGKLSCNDCKNGYGRAADMTPVTASSAPLSCSMLECDGTNKLCGCTKDNMAVVTESSGNFICKPCTAGFERSRDSKPVTTTQACVVIQCTGGQTLCGCQAGQEVIFSSDKKGSCSSCAAGYQSNADAKPVGTNRECTLAGCNGQTTSCGCLSVNQKITKRNGKLSCSACVAGYERSVDTAPATNAKDCSLKICDGKNTLCGCNKDHGVEDAVGRKSVPDLICVACAPGLARAADTTPVGTKSACTIIKCAGAQSTCGCPEDHAVTGSAGQLNCAKCSAGFSRKADTTVVSAVSPCMPNHCEPMTVDESVMYSVAKLEGKTGDVVDVRCNPGMKGGGKVSNTTPFTLNTLRS